MERHGGDCPLVDVEVPHELACGQVPELHLAVLPAGGNPAAVGAEPDGGDGAGVALVRLDAGLPSQVPNLEVGVCRSGCKELTVRMKLHGAASGPVPGESSRHLAVLQIPDLHGPARAADYQHLLLLVKDEALHSAVVAGEAHHGVGLANLPDVDPLVFAPRSQDLARLLPEPRASRAACVRDELLELPYPLAHAVGLRRICGDSA
mmetsp:Transcript_21055/g.63294  ORF Transcript_21055/g.63294 Transcript_21055/m.63294 type:complete len:206 (-) Transcript_21055:17-634(-)